MSETIEKPAFQIFRMMDSPSLDEVGAMALRQSEDEIVEAGINELIANGGQEGGTVKTLFNFPGFSLTYAWFKSGYPLPLHSHDADCLYYVISGTLKLGTELLNKGDGFFVPAETPYTYTPGDKGVEILEFRHATQFDIHFRGSSPSFWQKIADRAGERRDGWADEVEPSRQHGSD